MLFDNFISAISNFFLFCLVFGMSATVDFACLQAQLKNSKAIMMGIAMQFIVMPFLGFLVVQMFQLEQSVAIILMVVTASPGGTFSNWWCSTFNADLALSVTMTAISTLLSILLLPLNLALYLNFTDFNSDQDESEVLNVVQVNWRSLIVVIVIVISGILTGLAASKLFHSHRFNLNANRLGNFAAFWLIAISAFMANSQSNARIWNHDWKFYVAVPLPGLMGLILANAFTTFLQLLKPERVTVSIECCLQNVGIATSIALAMYPNQYESDYNYYDQRALAIGVPFYYGLATATMIFFYCLIAWKAGWTKAPPNVSIWKAVCTPYEILSVENVEKFQAAAAGSKTTSVAASMGTTRDDEEDAFHYVQHTEIMPQANLLACGATCGGDLEAVTTTVAETNSFDKANQRRAKTHDDELKESSYVLVD